MKPWNRTALILTATLLIGRHDAAAAETTYQSHAPERPLPVASPRPMGDGPAYFVDPVKGADLGDGTKEKPWKRINDAVRWLKPGDTLILRGGTYYQAVTIGGVSGTVEKPITIRAYPGELAIIDAGLREFVEDPAGAWEPFPGGAAGEFRSTKSYTCGGGFGNFADSMIPFHRYLNFFDLRSANEFYPSDIEKRGHDPRGVYCGPGTYRDPDTGRIHIRLAHTQLPGLGDHAYRGETDPRKLPLVIGGQGAGIKIQGAQHVKLQDLVVRGAEQSAIEITEDAEDVMRDALDIELDGLTLYGSHTALKTRRVNGLRVTNCALRGHAAPWHSRSHHKYRALAGYLVYAQGSNIEIGNCELTDHHDCLQMYLANEFRFHHNFVDNFNDDGIEPGPKKERGNSYIYQNRISRCLNPFTAHGDKPEPVDSEAGQGVYVFRNVIDFRQGVYRATPRNAEDTAHDYLNSPTILLAHDHGGPVHPNYFVYHNTFLLRQSLYRSPYLQSWGIHLRGTTRRVFNNIFVQVEGLPGSGLPNARKGETPAVDDFQEDGNLQWAIQEGPKQQGDFFAAFRQSPWFQASKQVYPPGWGASDLFADPQFARFDADAKLPSDLRLQNASPALDAGVVLPANWPDPLRDQDRRAPDLGAIPSGVEPWRIGVRGALSVCP